MSENINKGMSTDFILSYYKDRYDEARTIYRRLEDKVNYMLAVLGLEASALITFVGLSNFDFSKEFNLAAKFSVYFIFLCAFLIIFSFYCVWKSLALKNVPKMPIHSTREQIDFLLLGSTDLNIKYHLLMYVEAVESIESIHEKKSLYVYYLFNGLAISFIFFTLSVFFLFLSKVIK